MAQDTKQDDEIDLVDLLFAIWARKFLIAAICIAAVILGFFYAKAQTPIYQATALVQLDERSGGSVLPVELQALSGSSSGRAATEVEILRSRSIALDAVETLGLHIDAEPRALPVVGNIFRQLNVPHFDWEILAPFAWSDENINVGVLRVPTRWVGAELTVRKTGDDTFEVILPDSSVMAGTIGNPIENASGEFALRIDELKGALNREFIVSSRDLNNIGQEVTRELSVAEVGRQSSILRLSYQHPDPVLASTTLDTIIAAYIRQNIQRGAASAEKSLEFIETRLPDAEAQVAAAQLALNSYQRSVASVDLTFETQQVLTTAADIEAQLSELQMAKAELALDVTPNHPSYKRLEENEQILLDRLNTLREDTQGLPEQQLEVFNLTRDYQVAQEVYQSLLQRRQELQVVRASTIGNIRVIDNAFTARAPIAPKTSMIIAMSAVLGLLLGIAVVLVPRLFRNTVDGVEDIEQLGLSVFASVGFSKLADNSGNKNKSMPILAIERPTDLSIEAIRSLRTSLHFGMLDAKSQSLAITSPSPGVGKSFTSVNLAAVMAQAGQNVIVIDADLRRGVLRKYFDVSRDAKGLSDVLSHEAQLDDVIQSGPIPNLHFITSGKYPPNPSELLMRPKFGEVIDDLTSKFDFVIVDAPPILAVTDPVVISKYVGANMIAARHKLTAVPELEAAVRIFEGSGKKFMGAILNGFKPDAASKGGYQYYYNKQYAYQDQQE